MEQHVLDDPGALTVRAQRFLAVHGQRDSQSDPNTLLDQHPEGDAPEGWRDWLREFGVRYDGLSFCQDRPACVRQNAQHVQQRYCFESNRYYFSFDDLEWELTESGDWYVTVGYTEGWPLTYSWSTGRIGCDVMGPDYWIAHSATNLIESAALGQYVLGGSPYDRIRRGDRWEEAIPVDGKGPGWGLAPVSSEQFRDVVPESVEASSPWNRWFIDDEIAVHAWQTTYESPRREVVMAWYRSRKGRRKIESITGPLRAARPRYFRGLW